jgi:EAL domain-containing protein (putative c-di-GMP-specific phosphodiesterase class I)
MEQLQFLQQEGCDEIQGYYFAKPMPLDDFIAFCKGNLLG